MKVKIIKTTIASGELVYAGKIYDLSDKDAKILLAMGKAVPVANKAKKAQERDSELAEGLNTRSASAVISGKNANS